MAFALWILDFNLNVHFVLKSKVFNYGTAHQTSVSSDVYRGSIGLRIVCIHKRLVSVLPDRKRIAFTTELLWWWRKNYNLWFSGYLYGILNDALKVRLSSVPIFAFSFTKENRLTKCVFETVLEMPEINLNLLFTFYLINKFFCSWYSLVSKKMGQR